MTREKSIKILSVLKATYPNTYREFTKKEAEQLVEIYQSMFSDEEYPLITIALKELIGSCKFAPTIAEIKDKMYDLTNQESTPNDLWIIAKEMISNGLYMTQAEFDLYPEELKAFFGSTSGVKQIAMMDSDVVNSVTKGQFLKQIEIIQQRQRAEKKMLPDTRQKLLELQTKLLGD